MFQNQTEKHLALFVRLTFLFVFIAFLSWFEPRQVPLLPVLTAFGLTILTGAIFMASRTKRPFFIRTEKAKQRWHLCQAAAFIVSIFGTGALPLLLVAIPEGATIPFHAISLFAASINGIIALLLLADLQAREKNVEHKRIKLAETQKRIAEPVSTTYRKQDASAANEIQILTAEQELQSAEEALRESSSGENRTHAEQER